MFAQSIVYICAVFLWTQVETYSNAKRKWQLGNTGGTWEHEKDEIGAVYPTFSDPIKVGSGHPSLSFKAFYFDGSSDYVKLILSDADQFKTFSVFMLVYPETTSGPLLHYKYGSAGTDGLDDITITANNGNVDVHVKYQSNTWSFTDTSVLASNSWQYVIFKRNYDNSEIGLNVNGASTTHGGPTVEYLGTPGTLWVGRNIDTGNYFTGKITCVLLFDYVFVDNEMSQAYSECNSLTKSPGPSLITDVDLATTTTAATTMTTTPTTSSTTTTPTTTATTTTVTTTTTTTTTVPTTTTTANPVSFWRLDNTTYVHSIDGVAPMYPSLSQCVRRTDGCPDIAGRQALMLDGATVSYFDFVLSAQVIQGDFQIAIEIRPGYPSTGTILHYIYTGSEPGINEVKVSVVSTSISLTLSDSGTSCGQITQDNVLQSDTWHYLMIERHGSGIGLTVDSNKYIATDSCTTSAMAGEGYIRLGNSVYLDDVIRGSITCLGVYDDIQTDRKTSHRTFCQTLIPIVSSFDTDVCNQVPEMRDIHYSLEKLNVQPQVGRFPMTTTTTTSLRHCGRLCIETKYCIAFTVKVNLANDRECKLYDFVTRNEGLVDTLGTNYYVIHYRE